MLVLTRKIGEKILIGDDITLTVVDLGPGRMKLGISAPPEYRILRSELVFDLEPTAPADEAGIRPIRTGVAGTTRQRIAEPVGA
ncbi:MAG: carbon storage regulator [Isosphaeraceae bacterium]